MTSTGDLVQLRSRLSGFSMWIASAGVLSCQSLMADEALRFHANVDGSAIEKSRVIASARLLLAHPDAADFIIRNLAQWEDWQSLTRAARPRNASITDSQGVGCDRSQNSVPLTPSRDHG